MDLTKAPDPDRLSCPKCGSTDVRPSHSEGALAFFFAMFGRYPFRCRSCRSRFYRSTEAPDEDQEDNA